MVLGPHAFPSFAFFLESPRHPCGPAYHCLLLSCESRGLAIGIANRIANTEMAPKKFKIQHKFSTCNPLFIHSLEVRPRMKLMPLLLPPLLFLQVSSLEGAQRRKVMRQHGKKQKQGRDCRVGNESLPISVIGLMPHDQEAEKSFQK